jgi:rare lipoprotein A
MNQKLWSGLTTALLITTLGTTPVSYAGQSLITDEDAESNVPLGEADSDASTASLSSNQRPAQISNQTSEQEFNDLSTLARLEDSLIDAVKVGEYQSQDDTGGLDEAIASIYAHEIDGQPAATVYVRDIPVLTFLTPEGDNITNHGQADHATPSSATQAQTQAQTDGGEETKVASTQEDFVLPTSTDAGMTHPEQGMVSDSASDDYSSDPVWRATSVAARLNQLYRDNVDPDTISVRWDSERERYIISISEDDLVEMGSQAILPNTTNDQAEDALQAANRLRRQMGESQPLTKIEGAPEPESQPQRVSLGPVQFTISGMASWYGPGFNGRRSASGEIFNQNAMTAAHRTLPFGTLVEVTNVHNGRSVVVRINDRGPYSGRRVIDLSAAAARSIGMIQAGVAPVRINVLGSSDSASSRN